MIEIKAALLAIYGCKAAFRTSEFWFTTAPVFDTTSPGGRAAADGLCWHTSRESHPSEDLSELPPLLDPGITRGCGWTGVSLSDCWRGSGWVNQPQCETARHRLLCGRMGAALHLPWPSLMRFPAQVVLAHPPVSLQPSSRRTSRQRTYPAAGYEVFKEQKEDGFLPIFPVQGKLGQNTVHHLKIIAN